VTDSPVLVRTLDLPEGKVAEVLLNRPHARNAITLALAQGLHDALESAAGWADVVLVRGAGGHFCTGGDVQEVSRLREAGPEALRPLFTAFVGACELIAELPVPVVAAVEGYAMAGGFELLQSVDVALVRDDAVLCDNHVNHGLVPGGGGSQRLPRIVGRQRGLAHLLTGDRLSGAQAADWGLVYRSVAPEQFEAAVLDVVAGLARKDRSAVRRLKRLVREGLRGSLADGLALELEATVEHLCGAEGAASVDRFTAAHGAGR
jgi:enoyl-CoA hydratase/carnithine racemase